MPQHKARKQGLCAATHVRGIAGAARERAPHAHQRRARQLPSNTAVHPRIRAQRRLALEHAADRRVRVLAALDVEGAPPAGLRRGARALPAQVLRGALR